MLSLLFGSSFISDFLRPHSLQHTRHPCPSLSLRVCSNSCPLSRCSHPAISFSVASFSSYPQSLLASGVLTFTIFSFLPQTIKRNPYFYKLLNPRLTLRHFWCEIWWNLLEGETIHTIRKWERVKGVGIECKGLKRWRCRAVAVSESIDICH